MNNSDIFLQFLKKNNYINDTIKAKKDLTVETVTLKKASDLFVRDSITGLGNILKEDLDNHYYITTVKVKNVITQAMIIREDTSAEIIVYAHEGLIKQHLAEKTINILKNSLC